MIRSTVEYRGVKRKREEETVEEKESTETFWTDERAEEGWEYLMDVVYCGVDGYAYVRSLAEFVAPPPYLDEVRRDMDTGQDGADPADVPAENVDTKPAHGPQEQVLPLGVPLARYVEDNLVDMVTRGRHGWLRDVHLPHASLTLLRATSSPFCTRMAALPGAARAMAVFKARGAEQLDMAASWEPEELAKEGILEGDPRAEEERTDIERALMWGVEVIEALGSRVEPLGDTARVKAEAVEDAQVGEGNAMDVDHDVDARAAKTEPDGDAEEAPLMKRLCMNLLALAKRAPWT